MKKLAGLLLVVSFLRIGFAYADTTTVNSVEYLTGSTSSTDAVNQILVTLIGPQGEPGPAGVAGKDGVNGINGIDGTNGIDGAPGVAGAPGAPGESVQLVGDATTADCPNGGKVFALAGIRTAICNGANGLNGLNGAPGATGATGPQGAAGTGGTGGGGGFTYAQGEMTAGACDTFIAIKPIRNYTRVGFVFGGFKFGDTTITKLDTATSTTLSGGVNSGCLGQYVKIEFFTDSTYDNSKYSSSDHIVCTSRQTLGNYGPGTNGAYTLLGGEPGGNTSSNGGAFLCTSSRNNDIVLSDVSTADYNDKIGFSIG
jgi:hypothetical protein